MRWLLTIYERGGMTLQALREKIGDTAFSAVLRDWITQRGCGNATTLDFVRRAERVGYRELAHFFDVWLYQPTRPTSC